MELEMEVLVIERVMSNVQVQHVQQELVDCKIRHDGNVHDQVSFHWRRVDMLRVE